MVKIFLLVWLFCSLETPLGQNGDNTDVTEGDIEDFTVTVNKNSRQGSRGFLGRRCCKWASFKCNRACIGKPCTANCTVRCGWGKKCNPISCSEANPTQCVTTTTTTTTTTTSTTSTTSTTTTSTTTTTVTTSLTTASEDLPPRFILTTTVTAVRSYTYQLGEYARTKEIFNNFPVYKLEGLQYYFFYSLDGYWTVSSVPGGSGIISNDLPGLQIPPRTGWKYFENGRWILDRNLTWTPEYSTPSWFTITSSGSLARLRSGTNVLGLYEVVNNTVNEHPLYKKVGEDYFLYYSDDKHWVVGPKVGSSGGIIRSLSTGDMESPLSGWAFFNDHSWVVDKTLMVEPYNGYLHRGIFHEQINMKEMWNDHGTHAENDFSCWNPLPPNNEFVMLGSIPKHNYKKPLNGFVFHSSDRKAFSDPVGYQFMWNDKGTGADSPTSFWKPLCPSGYKSVGIYCQNTRRRPSLSAIKCVHEIYVRPCSSEWVWNDANSGSPKQVTVFKTEDPFVQGMEATRKRLEKFGDSFCLI